MNENPEKQEFRRLPEAELEAMQTVWDMESAGCAPEEIHAAGMMRFSPSLAKWKLTTVLTLMNRLAEKEFVAVRKVGRTNCYASAVDRGEYERGAAQDFVARVCRGSAAGVLSALLGGGSMSADEIAEFRSSLDEMEKKNASGGPNGAK